MFCLRCGTENETDSKFCKECGDRVAEAPRAGASRERVQPVVKSAGAGERLAPQIAEDLGAGVASDNPQMRRLLEMAFWHSEAGSLPAAIMACEAALMIDPDSTTALSLLGCLYERQGATDKAIFAFERVVALNPASEADREKLASLHRGERLSRVGQSAIYRWLPPALSGVARRPGMLPASAAVAAGGLVFLVGLALLRGHAAGSQAVPNSAPVASAAPTPTAASVAAAPVAPPPALQAPTPTAAARPSAPVYAAAPASAPPPQVIYVQPQPAVASPYNFAGRAVVGAAGVPELAAAASANPNAPAAASVRPLGVTAAQMRAALRAQQQSGYAAGLAAQMPQHTVVVASAAPPAAAGVASDASDDAGGVSNDGPAASQPVERMSIHVRTVAPALHLIPSSPLDGRAPTVDGGVAAVAAPSGAAAMQSKALGLQQQGNYHAAARAYTDAIAAYRRQVASGQGVEEAQRGIETCQTGLQICQQSL